MGSNRKQTNIKGPQESIQSIFVLNDFLTFKRNMWHYVVRITYSTTNKLPDEENARGGAINIS